MKSLAIRELLLPLLTKFGEPESLAPYFVAALYQALYRTRLPAGLAPRVVEAATRRCRELEDLLRGCELPSPERWAKDPLHPRLVRMAASLTTEQRAELGSLLLCYLHGRPLAAIALWWQEKADFEVCRILERYLGGTGEERTFADSARLEERVLRRASSPDALPPAAPADASSAPPPDDGERVLRYRREGRGGNAPRNARDDVGATTTTT